MRCSVYCTAATYQIKPLFEHFKDIQLSPVLFREVIHLSLSDYNGDIFYFPYGVMVFWGLPEDQERYFLNQIIDYQTITSVDETEKDHFAFSYGHNLKIDNDEIILPDAAPITKLAISHGLAQSVKLNTFENAIQKSYNSTKKIPEDLARLGKISLSRREIRRKMGELFIARNSINLYVDVLDTPEFFWEHPEVEPLYILVAKYLDISNRVEVLNERLNVVQELFQMLGSELNHQHSSVLEWIIILLIVFEVLISLLRDVFHVI